MLMWFSHHPFPCVRNPQNPPPCERLQINEHFAPLALHAATRATTFYGQGSNIEQAKVPRGFIFLK